jgi:putative FmdB family regulatory protein
MIKVRDYICTDCGHIFEKFQTSESEPTECPKCGSGKTVQTAAASSFKLTGRGVHDTRMKV